MTFSSSGIVKDGMVKGLNSPIESLDKMKSVIDEGKEGNHRDKSNSELEYLAEEAAKDGYFSKADKFWSILIERIGKKNAPPHYLAGFAYAKERQNEIREALSLYDCAIERAKIINQIYGVAGFLVRKVMSIIIRLMIYCGVDVRQKS